MSGGSYNYLFTKDAHDIMAYDGELSDMCDRLAGLGYADDVAREATELLLVTRQSRVRIESIQKRISDVFHAVEWWDSGDGGEDTLAKALARYRGEST